MTNIFFQVIIFFISLVVVFHNQSLSPLDDIYLEIWFWFISTIVILQACEWIANRITFLFKAASIIRLFSHLFSRVSVLLGFASVGFYLNSATPTGKNAVETGEITKMEFLSTYLSVFDLDSILPSIGQITTTSGKDYKLWFTPTTRNEFMTGKKVILYSQKGPFLFRSLQNIEIDFARSDFQVIQKLPNARFIWKRVIENSISNEQIDVLTTYGVEYAKRFPGSEYLLPLSQVFNEKGKAKEALTLLTSFLSQNPNDFEATITHGKILGKLGQNEGSRLQFEKALKVSPRDYLPYYELGQLYYSVGDKPRANEYFKRVLQMRKNFPEVQEILSRMARTPADK